MVIVHALLGGNSLTLRCGILPDTIAQTLTDVSIHGIVGNETLKDRIVGFFPRRQLMVL